ncbi:MAG: response regulator transcription factor [Oscillospiraceae bacterium]|nr:response regulator transcription factor [Oscillospiraceae bacterium]
MIGGILDFVDYIAKDIDSFPKKVQEGMYLFFGYSAAYITYYKDKNGSYIPLEYYGDSVYQADFEVFAASYAKDDVFVRNMDQMTKFSIHGGKYVWRIQDFENIPSFRESQYFKKGLIVHGVGYRCWITFTQTWRSMQHVIVVFKKEEAGDFTDEELRLLNEIGRALKPWMKLYKDHVDQDLSKAALNELIDQDNAGFCILNNNYQRIFSTRNFDSLSRRAWGTKVSLIEKIQAMIPDSQMLQKTVSTVTKSSDPCHTTYATRFSSFCSTRDETYKMQNIFIIQIREDSPGSVPSDADTSQPANAGSLLSRDDITRRELEVLKLVLDGLPVSAIADRMFISAATVRTHLSSLYRKFEVRNRAELIQKLHEKNLIWGTRLHNC